MKTEITLRLEDRNDFVDVLWDRVPSVGEIIFMVPGGTYRVSDVRNLMAMTNTGKIYVSSTVIYCAKLNGDLSVVSPPTAGGT